MIIQETIGNLQQTPIAHRKVDRLVFEWFELHKRIQRKRSEGGMELAIKFMKEGQRLCQDDILYIDDEKVVIVDVLPCDTILVKPRSISEMGSICYEIGNKHLPMCLQNEEILIPYEAPVFRWLQAAGYETHRTQEKLLNLLNSTVQPHNHGTGSSLFSKIIDIISEKSN